MGGFNVDITKQDCSRFDKLEELCDTFNVTDLIKSEKRLPIITNRQSI